MVTPQSDQSELNGQDDETELTEEQLQLIHKLKATGL